MRYRKKPVVIDALLWTSAKPREMFEFLGGAADEAMWVSGTNYYIDHDRVRGGLIIKTLEGEHVANTGDYIIKGIKGEYYPCKPDVFRLTYEALEGEE